MVELNHNRRHTQRRERESKKKGTSNRKKKTKTRKGRDRIREVEGGRKLDFRLRRLREGRGL